MISIILPAFNRVKLLKIALDSVLAQSFSEYEVILCDDSDNNYVQEFVQGYQDSRIKYYKNETRLGASRNVQKALSLSKYQYISILNDDDFWHEDYLSTAFNYISKFPDAEVFFCDHWLVDEKGVILKELTDKNTRKYGRDHLGEYLNLSYLPQLYINYSIPVAMGSVIKGDLARKINFPKEIVGSYDWWLMLNVMLIAKQGFVFSPMRLTYYRLHTENVTNTMGLDHMDWEAFLQNFAFNQIYFFSKKQRIKILKKLIQIHKTGCSRAFVFGDFRAFLSHYFFYFQNLFIFFKFSLNSQYQYFVSSNNN